LSIHGRGKIRNKRGHHVDPFDTDGRDDVGVDVDGRELEERSCNNNQLSANIRPRLRLSPDPTHDMPLHVTSACITYGRHVDVT
jgi:hypothetical protein